MSETIRGHAVIDRHLAHGRSRQTPRRIIVHSMGHRILVGGGESLYAATFLDKRGLSAHMLVAPDGTLIRCRRDNEGAWHAKGYNTGSLGIEILVDGEHNYSTFLEAIDTDWVTPEQYRAAVDVVAYWCHEWGIGTDPGSLDRHSDVDGARKSDPGQGWPWARFLSDVEQMR